MGCRVGIWALLCGFYVSLLVWLTWPLAAHLATHLPQTMFVCRFDTLHAVWALAWASHALAVAPARLGDANIYHPAPHALFYGPAALGSVPWFAPTFLFTGNPTLAANVVFIGGLALTALAFHLVVQRWTGSTAAGFLAAGTLLTTRWTLWTWIPTVPYDAVLLYFPLILFVAARPAPSFRKALVLLPLVVLQCLVEMTYVAGAVLGPLGLLALVRLARRSTRAAGLRLLAVLALAVVVLLPVYAGYVLVRAENPMLDRQTPWVLVPEGTDLREMYLAPAAATAVPAVAALVAVAGGLSFALRARRAGAVERAAWTQGAFWVLAGVLLSLQSPFVLSGVHIPIPQDIVHGTRIYRLLRIPARLAMAALMGLVVMTGLGFAECTRWLGAPGRRWPAMVARGVLAVLVGAAMYGEYRSGPAYGRTDGPPRDAYQVLGDSYPLGAAVARSRIDALLRDGEGPVLYLPIGPQILAIGRHARAMYRSIYHWRPILNGYSSYWPARFPERMALADRLPDPEALAALREQTGLTAVVVAFRELRPRGKILWRAAAQEGGRQDLRLVAEEDGYLLFEVADQTHQPSPAADSVRAPAGSS